MGLLCYISSYLVPTDRQISCVTMFITAGVDPVSTKSRKQVERFLCLPPNLIFSGAGSSGCHFICFGIIYYISSFCKRCKWWTGKTTHWVWSSAAPSQSLFSTGLLHLYCSSVLWPKGTKVQREHSVFYKNLPSHKIDWGWIRFHDHVFI